MAKKFVSRVDVLRNGAKQQNLKNFVDMGVNWRESIDLMDGVGTIDQIKKYGFSIDVVVPKNNPSLKQFDDCEDETWSVLLKGGSGRVTYTGVDALNAGQMRADGQGEMVRTITFAAEDMVEA
jgi:hypothetical protein